MKRHLNKSQALQSRADRVIAGGALTNSKRPQSFVRGVYPTHIERGIDALAYDVDQNKYVDYICGLGTHLFGYRNERIHSSVTSYLANRGAVFSLGTELEVEVAETICDRFNFIEQLRFLKTGTEACSAAIRIARVATGRPYILSHGFHGWSDEFVSLTPPANGIYGPKNIFGVSATGEPDPYFCAVARAADLLADVAAIIIEPVITDMSVGRMEHLRTLRAETSKAGTLLIFDETITGLRFPQGSVAKYSGVDPDLIIMGKALGGGFPLALVGGRRDVMSTDYFVSSTFAGDCVGLAAANAVFDLTKDSTVLERLEVEAKTFQRKFNDLKPDLAILEGYGTRGAFKFANDITKALFMQECCKAGVLFGPSFFYGTKHAEHDEFTLSVCKTVLNKISNNEAKLEGELPVTPFAQAVREQ